MLKLDENFQYLLNKFGPPKDLTPLSTDQRQAMSGYLPPSYMAYLEKFGLGSLHNGLFWLCDPEQFRPLLALIFGADKELHHKTVHVTGYSAFGELTCWSDSYYDFSIDLVLGQIFCPALLPDFETPVASKNHIASSLLAKPDYIDYLDINGEPMFDRCTEMHGPLEPGECYGFFPALALAGGFYSPSRRVENIKRVKALEHFTILTQLQSFKLVQLAPEGYAPYRDVG